jgi:hypothetical protein
MISSMLVGSSCGWATCCGMLGGIYWAGLFWFCISSMAYERQYWHLKPCLGIVIFEQLKHQKNIFFNCFLIIFSFCFEVNFSPLRVFQKNIKIAYSILQKIKIPQIDMLVPS